MINLDFIKWYKHGDLMESIWNKVKANMKALLPDHSFRMWIQPIQFIGYEVSANNNPDSNTQGFKAERGNLNANQTINEPKSAVIKLACPNSFSKKRIKESYIAGITQDFLKLGYEHGLTDVVIDLDIANRKADTKTRDTHKDRGYKKDIHEIGFSFNKDKTTDVDKGNKTGLIPISISQLTASAVKPKTAPAVKKNSIHSSSIRSTNKNPIGSENYRYSQSNDQLPLPGLTRIFDTGRMLKKDYTFDQFVVGNNNDFAYSASLSLAQGGSNSNGALYLLAGTGLGKSHLAQAVGHHVINQGITNKVFYITAEDFTNEMVYAIQNHTINNFKEKYRRKCDVLILEDIHFLSGKEATQKELAITLDYLLDADKKIIFSGCYLPDDIPKMNDQLKSRLTMGLVTKMEAPDFETRVKIIKKKSQFNGYKIPNEVTDYIAQELCDNVRQLESGLSGIITKGSLMGEKINLELARAVLENISKSKKNVTIDTIKRLICNEFGISESELVSTSRKNKIVYPRQVAIYLSRKYTDQPIKTIGKSFNRYHATAIHSINSVEKAIQQQTSVSEQLNYLYKKIESGKI